MEAAVVWLDWWLRPLSGASTHELAPWAAWHGRAMVLAWGVLVPVGAMLARFGKVMPGQDWPRELDNPAWWHGHRLLQGAALALMVAGLGLAWGHGGSATTSAHWHAVLGFLLVASGLVQLAGGLLRGSKGGPTQPQLRGDHYDMTARRVRFERLHKSLGWASWALSIPCIVLGLVVADAPRWMLLALGVWWLGTLLAFAWLQGSGRCVDTYQAIWGPDPSHPGNRRPPVGWGVRRHGAR